MITGVGENDGTTITLYPNPAKESIRILGIEANSQVEIYNSLSVNYLYNSFLWKTKLCPRYTSRTCSSCARFSGVSVLSTLPSKSR